MLSALLLVLTPVQSQAETLALVHATVIPMSSDKVLHDYTIRIENGRILALGPSHVLRPESSDRRIDCNGKFVMPGLVDMHVHLHDLRHNLSYLQYGVTSVFHLDGRPLGLEIQRSILGGEVVGPRTFVASTAIGGTPLSFRGHVETKTAAEAEAAVRRLAKAGYQAIKVYNNVDAEMHAAICSAAGELGLPVIGHIPRTVGAAKAFENGQIMVAHAEEFFFTTFKAPRDLRRERIEDYTPDEGTIAEVVALAKRHGVLVTPNLSFIANTARLIEDPGAVFSHPDASFLGDDVLSMWRQSAPQNRPDYEPWVKRERIKYPLMQRLTLALSRGGVPLLAGTDASVPGCYPGLSMHQELQELVLAGLSNRRALEAATVVPGRFLAQYRMGVGKVGTIEEGSVADLIILPENPLVRISALQGLEHVIVFGRHYLVSDIQRLQRGGMGVPTNGNLTGGPDKP